MQLQLKQTVWVQCYPASQNQVGFGAIYKFYDTEEGPAFEFYDEINGGFRIGLVKDIIEKPNGRMMGQYAKAKNYLANVGKEDKKKKMAKIMDEGAKPDFLDMDKDGDKKEPMKKAVADKGGDKPAGKKGMSDKQAKYFGKKTESAMMPKGKKRPVKESIENILSFKDMIKLVQESGGQQQIDPVDQELFAWAQRVAKQKIGEGMKAEVYAGLVYERMGGRFEMYDVLAEDTK